MVHWRAFAYGIALFAVLAGLAVLASIVTTIVSLAITTITAVATLLVVGALAYAAFAGRRWLRDVGDDDARSPLTPRDTGDPEDPVARLTDRYVAGELTEAELERRLEYELEHGDREATGGGRERSPSRARN